MPRTFEETLRELKESDQLECKKADGRDGQGELPKDTWETYSAFANTKGGYIILGMTEGKNFEFSASGVVQKDKIIRELYNNSGNPEKVSTDLLDNNSIETIFHNGKYIIKIRVRPAKRQEKPVYLNGNPYKSYKRMHDGDRKLSKAEVKRMLAEQIEETRDAKILTGYTIKDLSRESLQAYRQIFQNRDAHHPWNILEDQIFIEQIGAYNYNRETEEGGITIAGLLMFGHSNAIQSALPHYFLDYKEIRDQELNRWTDRIRPDGKWTGNIFDFYREVYQRISRDTKTPFHLKNDLRIDESLIHQAIREALVNALVHADYSDRAPISITKSKKSLKFCNPGKMRIPIELAVLGGKSDCRNRVLHKIFDMAGLGERAGSGMEKIKQGWEQTDRAWEIKEQDTPYPYTSLELFL